MTNLDSILKNSDIILLTKFHLVKAMVFPVVMYVKVGLQRKLRAKELILLNCGVREDSTHGHHQVVNTKIRLIIFFAAKYGEALYSQQKQDRELTVAQIMNTFLPNSDLN